MLTPPCQVRCYLSQLVKREPEGHLFKKVSSTVHTHTHTHTHTGSASFLKRSWPWILTSVISCGWDSERRNCRQRKTAAGQLGSPDPVLPLPLTFSGSCPSQIRLGELILSLRLELLKEVERLQVGPNLKPQMTCQSMQL